MKHSIKTYRCFLEVAESPVSFITSPSTALVYSRQIYSGLDADQEHLTVLALDMKNKVVGFKTIFTGAVNRCISSPREVFRAALLLGATAIIWVHNHPDIEGPGWDTIYRTREIGAYGRTATDSGKRSRTEEGITGRDRGVRGQVEVDHDVIRTLKPHITYRGIDNDVGTNDVSGERERSEIRGNNNGTSCRPGVINFVGLRDLELIIRVDARIVCARWNS